MKDESRRCAVCGILVSKLNPVSICFRHPEHPDGRHYHDDRSYLRKGIGYVNSGRNRAILDYEGVEGFRD